MNASIAKKIDVQWAQLRVWAAGIRDSYHKIASDQARTLITLLDTWDKLKENTQVSSSIWRSCLLLARDIRKSLKR